MSIDIGFLHLLNAYAGQSAQFDQLVVAVSSNNLLKAGPIMAILWGKWFAPDAAVNKRREAILSTLVAAWMAAVTSVALTRLLPMRPRPLVDPNLQFTLPIGIQAEGWVRPSSLPSDHAALYFALAMGIFFVAGRRWGLLAMLHAALLICLPRAYLGLHYLSDLVAGALIGIAFAGIAQVAALRTKVSRPLRALESARPEVFYPLLFLACFETANLFHPSRQLVGLLINAVAHH